LEEKQLKTVKEELCTLLQINKMVFKQPSTAPTLTLRQIENAC